MSKPLIVATDLAPTAFDMEQPRGFLNNVSADLSGSLYDQLTYPRAPIDGAGTRHTDWHDLEGRLAEAWWYSDDGLDCTFRLRRGVMSSAGNELTAEDVKWGWDRAFALRDVGKWMSRIASVQEADSVEVIDRYTVVFHQIAPNPGLPRLMAQCTPSVYDSEEVRSEAAPSDEWGVQYLPEHPAGFGPYRLAGLGEDETVLAANERYFRGRPAIDEVRVRPFGDRQEAIEALLAGRVDFVSGVSFDEAQELRGRRGVRIVTSDTPPGMLLQIDPSEAPFDDPLVRQAVACAVPSQQIIQTAYLGSVRRWRSVLQPETPGYLDEWPYEEDIDRARALLAASSRPDGFATRLVAMAPTAPDEFLGVPVEVLRAGLGRLGIDLTVEYVTGSGQLLVTLPKANLAPLMLRGPALGGRGARAYDPCYALFHDYAPGRMRLTKYVYDNPAFYDALRAIPTAGHGAPWLAAVHQAQRILAADAVVLPICGSRYYVAHRDSLDGYRWYPDNTLSFFDLHWT